MPLEELLKLYKELAGKIAELEQQKKEISLAILEQMPEKTVTVGDYIVRRYDRLSFQVPLEIAREISATKMEEILDKTKLKQLYESGQKIPGISPFRFVQVSLKSLKN